MIIAQISDTHLPSISDVSPAWDEHAQLGRVVRYVNDLNPSPDIALITGDLAKNGTTEEYLRLEACLSVLQMPYFIIPGNHDDRRNLLDACSGHRYLPRSGTFLHYVVEGYPLRLIALDSVVPGQPHGQLCSSRLAWLSRELAQAPDKPTLLFMHHPPFDTGAPGMDRLGCDGADALGKIVEQNSQIEAIICGHVHRAIIRHWHNTLVMTAPSTAYQLSLDLIGDESPKPAPAPPGFSLHLWQPESGLVSHVIYLADSVKTVSTHQPVGDIALQETC